MRLKIDLSPDLIADAMELSGHRTPSAVVAAALEEFIQRLRSQEIRLYKGRIDLDVDLDRLRNRG